MNGLKKGFTLVEVSLFLAITAVVFLGVAVGTQNSIFQQRYNDAVQSFASFLKTTYSQVMNVQSDKGGRSEKAIYGKMVVFSEDNNGGNEIISYNVIGKIDGFGCEGDNILSELNCLDADIKIKTNEEGGEMVENVGFVDSYSPKWASQIQTIGKWSDSGYEIFQGLLLIVRHPDSGTVYTFIDKNGDDVNKFVRGDYDLKEVLEKFETEDIDFCVNPDGASKSSLRRDVRIIKNARNASGVEIISDGREYVKGENVGNRCE